MHWEKEEYITHNCEESEEIETERCLTYYLKTLKYTHYIHSAGSVI